MFLDVRIDAAMTKRRCWSDKTTSTFGRAIDSP